MGQRSVASELLEKHLMRQQEVEKAKKKYGKYITAVRLRSWQLERVCSGLIMGRLSEICTKQFRFASKAFLWFPDVFICVTLLKANYCVCPFHHFKLKTMERYSSAD